METKTKILEDVKNPLFNRREIVLELDSESTPNREKLISLFAHEFKAPEGTIVVQKIQGNFGSKKFTISLKIYSSESEKLRIEPKPKEKKK